MRSILKSSPAVLSDFAMREMQDLKDEGDLNNASQMSVSMKTECGNSLNESETSDENDNEEQNLTTEMINQSQKDIPLIPLKYLEANVNELHPVYANSQDTGYQTESQPGAASEMDISIFYNINNNNSNKITLGITKACHFSNSNGSEFCQLDLTSQDTKPFGRKSIADSIITDSTSAMDVAVQQRLCSVSEENQTELFNQDSIMHISQSNWKPGGCSTPQNEKLGLAEF